MRRQRLNQFLQLFPERFGGFSDSGDVGSELVKRRHLALAQCVPMFLMNPKQFDEEINRIIIPDFILFFPLTERLQEFLVKVRLRFFWGRTHDFAGSNSSAADSISV